LEKIEMKKTLVALAAVSAVSAFAQVTISGVYDVGYQSVNVDKNPTARYAGILTNGVSTSAFFFKGTEDLGGGLKAIFLSELDFNATISNTANQSSTSASFGGDVYAGTPFNGEQYVGLQGDSFGSLKIGTPNSPALDANAMAQPFGTALGSGWSSSFGRMGTSDASGLNQYVGNEGSKGRIIRSEKAAVYTTPTMNGVTAQLEYSAQNSNGRYTDNDNGIFGAAVKYNNGPLNAMWFTEKASAGAVEAAASATIMGLAGVKADSTATTAATIPASLPIYGANKLAANASMTWNVLAANYTTGAQTFYVGMTTTKSDGMTTAKVIEDSKSYNVATKYVMGNVDFLANYLLRKSGLTSTQSGMSSTNAADFAANAKLIGLGVNYNLSKNTSIYGRYEKIVGLNATSSITSTVASNGAVSVQDYGNATQTKSMVGIRMAF